MEVDTGNDRRAEETAKFRPHFGGCEQKERLVLPCGLVGGLLRGCMCNFEHGTDLSISAC